MISLSVIGTAGRNKSKPLTKKHFEFMCNTLDSFLEDKKLDLKDLIIVSGGAAGADHVAVHTFLQNKSTTKLVLYLPCEIIKASNQCDYEYKDTGVNNWRTNPGRMSNTYHRIFQNAIGRNSINEIIQAKEAGATLDTSSNGFHDRNSKVAKSDYIVAFTFGEGDIPEKGGTLDTWNKSKSKNKFHFTIPMDDIPESKSKVLETKPKVTEPKLNFPVSRSRPIAPSFKSILGKRTHSQIEEDNTVGFNPINKNDIDLNYLFKTNLENNANDREENEKTNETPKEHINKVGIAKEGNQNENIKKKKKETDLKNKTKEENDKKEDLTETINKVKMEKEKKENKDNPIKTKISDYFKKKT
ncbi:hypothetical protein ACTA71_000987 [Dictyostelium dimigraforme]